MFQFEFHNWRNKLLFDIHVLIRAFLFLMRILLAKGVKMEDIEKVHFVIGVPNVEVSVGNNMG